MAQSGYPYRACDEPACPANAWALHFQQHSEVGCGDACSVLDCMDEHKCCNGYLFHAICHFNNVPEPEAMLRVMLRRTWLPSAFPTALQRLWQARMEPDCQPFDIKATTAAILQAAPAGYFNKNPTSLLPAIECACQPTAGPASFVKAQVEAAGLLLKAYPGVWQPSQLSAAITNILNAKPPPGCAPAAATMFNQSQTVLLMQLLNHCCNPAAAAGLHPTSFLHSHIKTALIAGAPPDLLELLLFRAPHWRPDDLRETDAQGVVVCNWARETSNYIKLFFVIVRAAVYRGATHQLLPALLYLVQPFQRGVNNDRGGYEQRMHYFLQALAVPDLCVTAQELLPLVKEAANTRNVKLLLGLSAASNKFRWPAAQLAPLMMVLAGGTEEYEVSAVKVLLQLGQNYSSAQMAEAVAAAADRAKAAPWLEARGFTQRMCDQLCAGGNWNSVAANAAALNLPAAAALLRKLYSNSKGGSVPVVAASPVVAAAAASAARLHTGAEPGQQQEQPAVKLALGQGVVGSAAASAVLAAATGARAHASWSAAHGAVTTQVATAATAAPGQAGSEPGGVGLVVPPVVTTAGKPPLSPVMSASKSPSMPTSPQPFVSLAGQEQQHHTDPAATGKDLMPPPPNKTMQQHLPVPPATARQPGQAAAVAHGGSMAAPCTLQHSPSEEMLAIAAATLATFKDSSVASLHHTSTNNDGRNGSHRPAAASPRSGGRPVHELHLNPNMSAAQIMCAVAPHPGGGCNGSPCSPIGADSSQFGGKTAARELPWQQLQQQPEQQAPASAVGYARQQPREPAIPLDLQSQGVLFQLFRLQGMTAGQGAGGAGAPLATSGQQQQHLAQPQQQGVPPRAVAAKDEPVGKLAGNVEQVPAAVNNALTSPPVAAAQEAGQEAASDAQPEQMCVDEGNAAQEPDGDQACTAAAIADGQAGDVDAHDSHEAKRQRTE